MTTAESNPYAGHYDTCAHYQREKGWSCCCEALDLMADDAYNGPPINWDGE
ncbi:hypothetical protein [Streptomyces bacillaris]|uniref:hypothetical protein n=1 Tax=Streptomyces bacillaris TaxID=68179 RepID=UPI0034604D02